MLILEKSLDRDELWRSNINTNCEPGKKTLRIQKVFQHATNFTDQRALKAKCDFQKEYGRGEEGEGWGGDLLIKSYFEVRCDGGATIQIFH